MHRSTGTTVRRRIDLGRYRSEVTKNPYDNFAINLTDNCKSHGEWTDVMYFGMASLLLNQPLLIELMTREAERMSKRFNDSVEGLAHTPSDEIRQILVDLNLKLVVDNGESNE